MSWRRAGREMRVTAAACLATAAALSGCENDLIFRDADLLLDDASVRDVPRLASDEVAARAETAVPAMPVAILVHGFGATTFELEPVARELRAAGALASQVLLRGHGTTAREMAALSYEEWAEPIRDEYARLHALGFEEVALVGSSTGAALVLDLLARGELTPTPRRIVLVSPLIEFADWRMRFLPLFERLGVAGSRAVLEGESRGHWYPTRPATSLRELRRLTARNHAALATGLELPADCRILVLHATGDPTVAGRGIDLLARGIRGAQVEIVRVDSGIHVPVKPVGCDREWTPAEIAIHKELIDRIRGWVIGP
jgi:carboxylesterase